MKAIGKHVASLLTETSVEALRKHDPEWLERVRELERVTVDGSLSPSVTLLVQIAIHGSVTGLSESALRHFISRALSIGISYEEIVAVLKLCTILGIHSAAQASPILEESLRRQGVDIDGRKGEAPMINSMRETGHFNAAWESLEKWDPVWLDRLLAVGLAGEIVDVLGANTFELLCIAIDATVTHIYHPGTRRHIETALNIGVPPREILGVVKLVSIQGIRSMDAGISILEEQINEFNSNT